MTNPTIIIEVLSRSTEEYDIGDKFEHYKTLQSLQQYILVSQRERALEVWSRGDGVAWQQGIVREGGIVDLMVGAQLDVREIYEAAAEPSS